MAKMLSSKRLGLFWRKGAILAFPSGPFGSIFLEEGGTSAYTSVKKPNNIGIFPAITITESVANLREDVNPKTKR